MGAAEFLEDLNFPGVPDLSGYYDVDGNFVHLDFSAAFASTYTIWRKGPGESEFSLLADTVTATFYNDSSVSVGTSEYQVVGRNARAAGPPSSTVAIDDPLNPELSISWIGSPGTDIPNVSVNWY